MNTLKTAILLALLTAIFMGLGFFIGGATGMGIAFVIALATNLFSYWNSDKVVLKMHGAVEADEASAPEFYAIVRQLSQNAGLPMPRVYIMHNPQPNAFATGRNPEHAAVAATTGLLDILNKEETAGVIAHELAHIKNRDTLIMTITATLAGAISMLANYGLWFGGGRGGGGLGWIRVLLVALVAPFAAMLVQMAISRTREYRADRLGAEFSDRPLWLASALRKISQAAGSTRNESAEQFPTTAHLFIINPLSGEHMDSLFTTHPSTENRVARLEALAAEWGQLGGAGEDRSARYRDRRGDEARYGSAPGGRTYDDEAGREGPWSGAGAKGSGDATDKGPWG